MILQCDQCQTKFRLDDSKMKPGGVKVRCSKCRHVFVAGAEPKQEESDFDAILSGLGAPAPEKQEEAPAAPQEPAGYEFAPPPPQEPPAEEAPKASAAPAAEPAAVPAEEPGFSAADFPDFSAIEFTAEPAQQVQQPEQPVAAPQEHVDFGAFEFPSEEETPKQEAQPSAPAGGLDYGEFSFMEEPAASKEETAAPAPGGDFDFGDFTFPEEPAVTPEKEEPAERGGGLDFGEFEFSAEPAAKPREPAGEQELEFGEFTFNEEPAAGGTPAEEKQEFDFSDFSFAEEPPPLKETAAHEVTEDLGAFSFGEEPETKPAEAAPSAPDDLFTLGEFSFAEEKETPPAGEFAAPPASAGPAPSAAFPERGEEGAAAAEGAEGKPAGEADHGLGIAAGIAAGVAAGAAAAAARKKGEAPAAPVPPVEQKKEAPKETPLDFAFGPKPVLGTVAEAEEEELPPLSISSRRKGRSMFTVAVLAVCVLLILALAGAGLYLTQSGPAAFEKFNKLGLGFVPKWFGIEAPDEGKITIKNPLASFSQNKEAGELFVVTGEAVNSYGKARASIRVKVSIFDKKGAVVAQKVAYCGNRLTKEQLETLPMSKIEAIMNNQFGDSLSNLGVKPGQAIPFVVAIPNVPKDAADFGVEAAGSTVAGQ